jgi:hypothetical protein
MPLSWLDDRDTIEKLNAVKKRVADLDITLGPNISAEQAERERYQAEENAYAEATPMFAVARAIASNYPILPLEPLGREPLADRPSRNMEQVYQWFQEFPTANIGVPVGRSNGLIAMHIEDAQAVKRLRRLTVVEQHDPDTGRTWQEHRALEGSWLRFVRTVGVTQRSVIGWGRSVERQAQKWSEEQQPPEEGWLLWTYPSPVTGYDSWDYYPRRVVRGVEVLGDGAIIPFPGSRFNGGLTISGTWHPLSVMPSWLASEVGKPRSRKVMQAAREAYELAEHRLTDMDSLHLVS